MDFASVQTRPIQATLKKYNIEIKENYGLNEKTGFWWLRFTFDYELEKAIEIRLTNFKYSTRSAWTLEVVKCQYLSITCADEMDSFDMEDDLVNRPYSYSQYWTGTSLQWRLMRGNILKSICI